MTPDGKLKAEMQAKMRAAGITVEPAPGGGFNVHGVPEMEFIWAATENHAWAQAYAFLSIFQSRGTP